MSNRISGMECECVVFKQRWRRVMEMSVNERVILKVHVDGRKILMALRRRCKVSNFMVFFRKVFNFDIHTYNRCDFKYTFCMLQA